MPHDDTQSETSLDIALVKRLLRYVSPYRRLVLRLVFVMTVFAFVDSFTPMLTKIAVDRFAVPRRTDGLALFAVVCLFLAMGRGVANLLMIRTGGRIYTGISHDIRRNCFNHLQDLPLSYYDQHPVGWILARITSDSTQIGRSLSWNLVDMVDAVGKLILMTVLMLSLDIRLACLVLAVVPLMAAVIWWCQKISLVRFREVRRVNSEVTAAFNEGIMGATTVKTLAREDTNLAEFSGLTSEMRSVSVSAAYWSSFYFPLALILGAVGSGLALTYGGTGVMNGTVSYGTLVAFMGYAVAFFQPLQDLSRRIPELQNAQASAERVFTLLDTEPEVARRVAPRQSPGFQETPRRSLGLQGEGTGLETERPREGEGGGNTVPLPAIRGAMSFHNVSFHYVKDEPVLKDFSLDVAAGETIALVGETGAGKTTIANLAARFYEPTAGEILIDGIPIRDLPLRWFQGHFGMVQQEPHMFSGTVAFNIRYGRLDATDEEVRRVARLAHVSPFIEELPDQYDFEVEEEGRNLSTGQKQLIALARVMLADPRLLILDEATSSVDTETDLAIQLAIAEVLKGRTSFIIAHRLSTIRAADRILLIDQGAVKEAGTHAELLRKDGAYAELYRSQFLEQRSLRMMRE